MSISKKITLSIALVACYNMSAMERSKRERKQVERYSPIGYIKKTPKIGNLIFLKEKIKQESHTDSLEKKINSSSSSFTSPILSSTTPQIAPYIVDAQPTPYVISTVQYTPADIQPVPSLPIKKRPIKSLPMIYVESDFKHALENGEIDFNVEANFTVVPDNVNPAFSDAIKNYTTQASNYNQ